MTTLPLADGLALPLAVVTEKLAFLGRTGSGKTYGAMKLAELMLDAGAQVGVIDPVGVWRGLRVPATKGGRSYDVVVFGGLAGADLPLEPTAGELVADLVSDRRLSFVLDISQLIPAEQQRCIHDFAARFFQRRKAAPAAVHLFLEECQEYLPENPSGLEARTLGVMQRLWKLGRNFGIGGSLISQRPQEIAKKALNMSGTLFAFHMTGPQERKTIRAWVADHGVATNIEAVLQKLKVGQPHVESPTFLGVSKTVQIRPRVTADLSSTPTVVGAAAPARPLTPIDVAQLREAMAATIEKAKADDPKALRARIVELSDLLTTERARGALAPAGRVTVEVLTDADRKAIEAFTVALRDATQAFLSAEYEGYHNLVPRVRDLLEDGIRSSASRADQRTKAVVDRLEKVGFQRILEKLERVSAAPPPADHQALTAERDRLRAALPTSSTPIRFTPERKGTSTPPRVNGQAAGDVTEPEQRILDALAWWAAAGVTEPTRHQVAFAARYTVNGHFNNVLGALRSRELVDYPNRGVVCLTAEGRIRSTTPGAPASRADLIERAVGVLREEPQRRLFTVVSAAAGPMSRDALAASAGYTVNGHFNNTLGALRSLGLVDYPDRGLVQLGAMFSLEGR